MNFLSFLKKLPFRSGASMTPAGIPVGIYPFQRTDNGRTVQYRLRVDPSGNGMLLADAKSILRLHPAYLFLAKGILEEQDENTLLLKFGKVFRDINVEHAKMDLQYMRELVAGPKTSSDNFPLLSIDDPSFMPENVPLERPMSADVPLCKPFYLDSILKRMWEECIPHVTIIAGKNPADKELVRAVQKAKKLGLIAGVRGFGVQLAVGSRISDLIQVGLDHLDIVCLSIDEKIHASLTEPDDHKLAIKSLVTAQKRGTYPTAVVPLVRAAIPSLEKTFAALSSHGIRHVHFLPFSTTENHPAAQEVFHADELLAAADQIGNMAAKNAIQAIWYPPVRRNFELTLAEQIFRGPRSSGDGSIRVEPDGRVFAARGPAEPLGNLLQDSWEKLGSSRVYKKFRRHVESHHYCKKCPHKGFCVADCIKPIEGPEEEDE